MIINIMKKKTIHINPQTLSRIFVKDKTNEYKYYEKKTITIHNQCFKSIFK